MGRDAIGVVSTSVINHPNRNLATFILTYKKMNKQDNTSTKSKEIQQYTDANAQSQNICFLPYSKYN